VPEVRNVQQTVTVNVPEVRQEKRQATVVSFQQVPEVVTRQVTCMQPQQVQVPVPPSCCNPCGGISVVCQMVPVTQNVQQTVLRCVPQQHVQEYTVNVTHFRPEQRNVTVPVYSTRQEVRSVTVPVTTCQAQQRTVTVNVPVTRPVTERYTATVVEMVPQIQKYTVNVCEMVPQTQTYTVNVVEYRQQQQKRRVPVTTYRSVARQVTETVPVTTCVPVAPSYGAGYGCMPVPSCY
jgi:hypothetical protein